MIIYYIIIICKCIKGTVVHGHNNRAEELTNNERYRTLSTKEKLSDVILKT